MSRSSSNTITGRHSLLLQLVSALFIVALLSLPRPATAFIPGGANRKAPPPMPSRSSPNSRSSRRPSLTATRVGYENKKLLGAVLRRDLLLASAVGVITMAGGIPLLPKAALVLPANAAADEVIGDLDAPTAEEVEAERVKAKLRRQKEAVLSKEKGGAEEQSYGDSLKREQEKQKSLKKDKKQRREDLCEKLGRGC